MCKVKFFYKDSQILLEREVNDFIQNKNIASISYSTNSVGYSIYHYCCVVYLV